MKRILIPILLLVLALVSLWVNGAAGALFSAGITAVLFSKEFWADVNNWRDFALLFLSIFLLIDGILHRDRGLKPAPQKPAPQKPLPQKAAPLKPGSEVAEAREERLTEAASQITSLAQERDQLRSEVAEVRQALQQERAKRPAASRDATIDAELLQLLGLLQERGRFIDFVMDDITPYSDEQVGAAARVVHQGCASIIKEFFDVAAVTDAAEGTSVTLEKDFDSARYRLIGKVVSEAPYQGTLVHHGWKSSQVKLPRRELRGEAAPKNIITPAEVQVG